MESSRKTVTVNRHDLMFRLMHWLIFVEGVLLTLTGFQLGGGIFGITFFPTNNMSYHVMLGIAMIATLTLFMYDITVMGLLFWWGPKKIPYSNSFVIAEFKAWFKLGPRPKDPILYDPRKKDYVERIIPSVVVSFWTFTILGSFLMVTGLMMTFPSLFSFFYYVFDPVGRFMTGVSGYAFVQAIHRLASELLVVLVALHIYAVFVFKLVKSMITGKREERILQ